MDARGVWKEFAMSDEGRALAEQLNAVEDDQLHKLGELDHKISSAMKQLAAKMDNKPLVAVQRSEAETLYRCRYFSDHVELSIKLPVEMVVELGEMWAHYEGHECPDAAAGLDAFSKTIVSLMVETLPRDVLAEYMLEEEEDEDDDPS